MPRATVSAQPKKIPLKTCPPDGYVTLRRMSYGELMASQDLLYQVKAKADSNTDDTEIGLDVSRAAIMEYQFSKCITDHNLENDQGQKLDFNLPRDVHLLDSNIGQEISGAIDDLHNWKKSFPNSEAPSGNESSTNGQGKMAKASDVTERSQTVS